jgi:hypothetical protein
MQLKEYRAIREAGIELGQKIFNLSTGIFKNELISAAKLLHMWDGKIIVFDAESDTEILMDFMVFEKPTQNAPAYQRFYDSKPELTGLQRENMNGILNFYSSLFEVKHIDSINNMLVFVDLLDANRKEYELMDVGLSQTASVGYIFYTRLIPIRDINMTSGMAFVFENIFKDKLLSAISLVAFKKRRKLTSTEMFLLIHEKNCQYGLKTRAE